MTPTDIARLRLHNQQIAHATFPDGPSGRTPGEVVAWMGAVQAQSFQGRIPGSKWPSASASRLLGRRPLSA